MKDGLSLTSMELFFLGVQMGAKLIDYSYIAAMPDIQRQYDIHERETLEMLEQRGLIEEDFKGNVEFREAVKKVLKPVFWGEAEGRIETEETYNVHLYQGEVTIGAQKGATITFFPSCREELRSMISGKDVTIQCAKAGKGYRKKTYTAAQMKGKETVEEALTILMGDD